MKGKISHAFEHFLTIWVRTVSRFALPVVLLIVTLTSGALYYTVNHIGISTDTGEMFSPDLPFRQTWQRFKDAFPKQIDTFVVVIDGENPQQARTQAAALADKLRAHNDIFDLISTPGIGPFYDSNGLLFMDTPELKDLADRLALVQPFLARLGEDPSMRGLFDVTTQALEQRDNQTAEVDIRELLLAMDETLKKNHTGAYTTLPWQELMTGEKTDINDRRAYLIIRPHMDFSQLFPASDAFSVVRETAEALGITAENGMRLRITGELAMEYDELKSVSQGAAEASVVTLLLALLILWFTFRSARLLITTLTTLVCGLVLTAAFATWAVGTLNMISVAFAVLYIGLSLDFTIHFGLRYRELLSTHPSSKVSEVLASAAKETGHPLLLCTLTTAVGFYAFIPTAYDGVSELGIISGSGMFISFILTMTLFPALLALGIFRINPKTARPCPSGIPALLRHISVDQQHPIWRNLFIALILGAVCTLPSLSFDYNPLNLRAQESESVSTFKDLVEHSDPSPWYMTILTNQDTNIAQLKSRLKQLPSVDKVISLQDYIPSHQDEKLDEVDEISLLMGPQLATPMHAIMLDDNQAKASLENFSTAIQKHLTAHPNDPDADLLSSIAKQVNTFLSNSDHQAEKIKALQQSLVGSLPANLRLLSTSLQADYVTRATLPKALLGEWQSEKQVQRIAVFPKRDIADSKALRNFVDQVRQVVPDATGSPVNYLESGDAVVMAFQQALAGAFIVITLLLLIILRNIKDVFYTLFPLVIAGLFTAAFTVAAGIHFNFANIIALPLLLGIGVDNGIHMIQRYRSGVHISELMETSTTRGILFSALTTIVSFLSLAFSQHPGTASMGILLTSGMLFTLLATLVLLPALLERESSR